MHLKYFFSKCGSGLFKAFQNNSDSLKIAQRLELQKYSQEYSLITNDLKIAHERIEYLESNLKNYQILSKKEDQNIEKLSIKTAEKVKNNYNSFLRQLISQISFLEESISENYENLYTKISSIKEFYKQENEVFRNEAQVLLEQAKKSIDYYREKLIQAESEKVSENNKSQKELIGLEQRLSQVLMDIKEQRE